MPGKLTLTPWTPPSPPPEEKKFANEFLMSLCCRYLEHEAGEGWGDDTLGTLDDVVRFLKENPGAKGEGGGDAS